MSSILPVDDLRIYAIPKQYKVSMSSITAIGPTDGVRIKFPPEFYVLPNTRCVIGLQGSRYICNSYNTTNSVEIYSFSTGSILSEQQFEFTMENFIRNPGTKSAINTAFEVATITFDNKTIDSCTYQFPSDKFIDSNITEFKVVPIDSGVGQYPSRYHFELRPWGDIYRYSTIRIDMPPEITIFSKFEFEKSCGSNLSGFTNSLITCKTWDNKIWVN